MIEPRLIIIANVDLSNIVNTYVLEDYHMCLCLAIIHERTITTHYKTIRDITMTSKS